MWSYFFAIAMQLLFANDCRQSLSELKTTDTPRKPE